MLLILMNKVKLFILVMDYFEGKIEREYHNAVSLVTIFNSIIIVFVIPTLKRNVKGFSNHNNNGFLIY